MAEQTYTRTLEYKISAAKKAQVGTSTTVVPISSFLYSSGDNTHAIREIKQITIHTKIKRYNRSGYGDEYWDGTIVLKDGRSFGSGHVHANCSMGTYGSVSATFTSSQFGTGLKIDDIESINSKPKDYQVCTYFGDQPLYIEIVYTSELYYLRILNFECKRCDAYGNISLRGDRCLFSVKYEIGDTSIYADTGGLAIIEGTGGTSRSQQVLQTKQAVLSNNLHLLSGVFTPDGSSAIFQPDRDYVVSALLGYGSMQGGDGDVYEMVSMDFTLKKARAPLTYNNNSVGIGQYAQGTGGDERFDCDYPAYFHKGIHGVNVYSAGEIDTGGKWIGGKTIYRRMVTFDAVAGTNQTAHDSGGNEIQISGISALVNIQGVAVWPGTKVFVPLNFYAGNSQYTTVWLASDPSRIYYSSSSSCTVTLFIYYTK